LRGTPGSERAMKCLGEVSSAVKKKGERFILGARDRSNRRKPKDNIPPMGFEVSPAQWGEISQGREIAEEGPKGGSSRDG